MARLPDRPGLGEVQSAAVRHLQLGPGTVRRWLVRARSAAALPTVSAGYDVRFDRGWSLDLEPGVADALQRDVGNVSTLRFKATWELDRTVFAPDELRAARAGLDLLDWRERVLLDVTRLYFERLRLLLERELGLASDPAGRVALEIRVREIEGVLSGLTGIAAPWPTRSAPEGPQPASGI
jgi:hypothetical protein